MLNSDLTGIGENYGALNTEDQRILTSHGDTGYKCTSWVNPKSGAIIDDYDRR